MTWLYFIANVLAALAVLGVGVAVVRRASTSAGLLLAAAGAVELSTVCCFRLTSYLQDSQGVDLGGERGVQATIVGANCVDLLVVGLFVAAFLALAKQLRASRATA